VPPIIAALLRTMVARNISPDEFRDLNGAPRRDGATALDGEAA
jgi:hypothetical protein